MDQQILETGQMFFNDLRKYLLIIIRENPCQSVADKKITETVQLRPSGARRFRPVSV